MLKPGGALLLSFYGRNLWEGLEEAEAIRRGEFVFSTSEKLKGFVPDWYHTAFQDRSRIVAMLRECFSDVVYREGAMGYQDVAIAIKGSGAPA